MKALLILAAFVVAPLIAWPSLSALFFVVIVGLPAFSAAAFWTAKDWAPGEPRFPRQVSPLAEGWSLEAHSTRQPKCDHGVESGVTEKAPAVLRRHPYSERRAQSV